MAFEFRLPDIGEGLTEAEIVGWRVEVGDHVEMDEIVADVETDKAVVEIPTPVAGTVLHMGGAAGDVIDVGAVLIVVGEAGEVWPADDGSSPPPLGEGAAGPDAGPLGGERPASGDAAPIVGTLDTEVTRLTSTAAQPSTSERRPPALPVVRKLARELGVDLASVAGSGPGGRVTRDDVESAAGGSDAGGESAVGPITESVPEPGPVEREAEPPAAAGHEEDSEPGPEAMEKERRPLSATRRTIAAHMSRSWAEIPHVTAFDEVDATRLIEVKRALTKRTGSTISIDALVTRAVVPALRMHPDFNALLDGDALVDRDEFDIGVAVDTPDGLMVVVVRDVASKTLAGVSGEIAELASAAKQRRASPDQLSGQTFTVSNIGALGGGHGTPIVPYGTIGILSVGRASDRPVARDGKVVIAPVMPLSLSYDHRVIDGAQGRRFLALVVENLTEPALFLAD